jgi:O-antigen ligase
VTAGIDFAKTAWVGACAVLALALGIGAGVDPQVAIAASFGLAFVVVVIADLTAGLVAFTFLALMELVPFGSAAVSFSKLLGLLLVLSWLVNRTATSQRLSATAAATIKPAAILLLAFLSWIAVSAVWADEPSNTLAWLYRYVLNGVLFLIVCSSLVRRSQAAWVIGAFAVGAVGAALYGIGNPGALQAEYGRLESAALDPNELAAVVVPAFMICLFTALGLRRGIGLRVAAGVGATLCLMTLVLTVSRGGLIALTFALVLAIVVAGRWRGRVTMAVAMIGVAAVTYFAAFASPATVDRIAATTRGDVTLVEGRVTIWQVGWRMFENNPLIGVGSGNFQNSSKLYVLTPGEAPRSDLIIDTALVAHNTYLGILAELGLIGLGLFLGIIGYSLMCLVRAVREFARRRDREMELLTRALLAGLPGLLIADFFLSEEFSKALWLLLGLGPAMLVIARGGERPQPPPEPAEPPQPRVPDRSPLAQPA